LQTERERDIYIEYLYSQLFWHIGLRMPCFSSKGKISLLVLAVYAAGSPNMGNCLARESNVPCVETSQNCTDHLPTFFWKDVPGRLLVLLVVHRIQRNRETYCRFTDWWFQTFLFGILTWETHQTLAHIQTHTYIYLYVYILYICVSTSALSYLCIYTLLN
jgi:hypothetical protein